jgi:ATP-binding cassette, subfamily C, bacterial CydD
LSDPSLAVSRAIDARLMAMESSVRWSLRLAVVLGFLGTVVVIGAAYVMSGIIAAVFLGGSDVAAVTGPLLTCAVLAVTRIPLQWGSDALALRAAAGLKARLRADLTGQLVALGPTYADRERTGELTSTLLNGMADIDAFVAAYQPARMLAVAIPVLVVVVILVLDPPTTLVLLVTGPVLVLLLAMIGSRTGASSARRFAEMRWLSAFFLDMLQGIGTLKTFGRSAEQVETIRTMSRRYGDTTMEVLGSAFQTSLVLEWGAAVAVALVAVEISLRLMTGSIPFERALAVLIIVPEFFLPLRVLATRYHAGSAGRTAAERMFAILDTPRPASVAIDSGDTAPGAAAVRAAVPSSADIVLEAVNVTYPDRLVAALAEIDLTIHAGESLALVGPTGAGKSTLARLLLRFIEPDTGTIRVGDRPLTAIDLAAWRAHVAWVPQRPHLFDGTIADNIRLALPDADDAAVQAAAAAAGIDEVVRSWPRGLDTPTGERGSWLSGGQRQRVALARAFLSDAPLVILDEITSQLDPASEERIREALARLARDRTVLVVSHRMRLVSSVDRVVVLEGGRIVQTGSPADLAAVSGPYRRILATARADEAVA